MFPAGLVGQAGQPGVDIGPVGTVETERLGIIKVTTARQIRVGHAVTDDPIAAFEMVLKNLICRRQTALRERDDICVTLRFRQEVHQKPGHARLRGKLVIVPQHPAQDFIIFFTGLATELARFLGDISLDAARLADFETVIDQNRRFAHFVDVGAIFWRAGLTLEEIDKHRLPVQAT